MAYFLGLYVVGPGDQGILLEHRESEFGDHASHKDILEAVKKMKPVSQK